MPTLHNPLRRPSRRPGRHGHDRHGPPGARAVLGALTVAVLLLTACGGDDSGDTSTADDAERVDLAGEDRSVAVGVLRQPHLSHPLFYGDHLPANVDLEVIPFASSTEIKNAVVSGDLDFGVTGITSALQGAAAGEPVVVVAGAADGGSSIVAGADSGIEGVEDLEGKRIGYVPASAQDILLRLTLQDAGLDPASDVELVNVGFADMPGALAGGDIDAFSGAEVGPSQAIVAGDATLVTHPYDTAMGRINISLVTSQSVIDDDPELVQAMVDVHARATEAMAGDNEAWAAEVESAYGFSPDALDMAIDNIFLEWQVDDGYIAEVEVLGQQQLALGQIEAEPDYAAFVDPSFVQALAAG